MTEPVSFFRREAIEYQTRQPGPGDVLRVAPRWTGWMYWFVLVLVVAGVAVGFTVRTDKSVSGPALIDVQKRTFVALVSSAAPSNVRSGQRVRLVEVGASAGPGLAGRALRAEVANAPDARRAGFDSPAEPAILVTGELASPAVDVASLPSPLRTQGQVVVVVGSEPVAEVLVRGLQQMFGQSKEQ
jgi:hypothetical protein